MVLRGDQISLAFHQGLQHVFNQQRLFGDEAAGGDDIHPGKEIALLLRDPQRRDARIDCRVADSQLGRGWNVVGSNQTSASRKIASI